jgi:hypothetical protein
MAKRNVAVTQLAAKRDALRRIEQLSAQQLTAKKKLLALSEDAATQQLEAKRQVVAKARLGGSATRTKRAVRRAR